jgi:SIR2-like protein
MPVSKAIPDYDIAFIFGAGASLPFLPSQTDLIPALWKATTRPFSPDLPIHLLLPARAYLSRTFPGLASGRSLTFEDVVGPLEISESEEYWFHYAHRDQPSGLLVTNRRVLDALDTWLAVALDPTSVPRSPSDASYGDCYGPGSTPRMWYGQLLSLLEHHGLLRKTVFVSLNYDILLDRCIIASGYQIDYKVEAFLDTPKTGEVITLLKLHGSLNWRSCDACHVLLDLRHSTIGPRSKCSKCGERTARPLLIRPTLLKDFRHRVWQDVWRAAGRALAGAKTWVFVGYSLPLADVWMLRLLAQSVRSGPKSVRQWSIVDPNNDVLERFRLLFPRATSGARTFAEYVERCRATGHFA